MGEFEKLLMKNVKSDIVGIKSAMKRIKFKIFEQNVRNNVAITFMKGASTSIQSCFKEKTYMKLLGKKSIDNKLSTNTVAYHLQCRDTMKIINLGV